MRDGIFVTGGTGFVGRPLLAALARTGRPIWALSRRAAEPAAPPTDQSMPANVTFVSGDVLQPETWRAALAQCRVLVHLAAATGRAAAETHHRVNARGTEILLEECRKAGVDRFLFVSSIATTFPDTSAYHYAEAKRRAEAAVAASGLAFTTLRPTIILGPGAPLFGALRKLALLPVPLMPGDGRVRIQPIHVDDVVRHIVSIVERDEFHNRTFDLGGDEILTMQELLRRIRLAEGGRAGSPWHVPLALIRAPLIAAEQMGMGDALPISAGQLTSFRFDGIVGEPRPLSVDGRPAIGVAQMIADSRQPAPASARVVAPPAAVLDRECLIFTRHLLGRDPDDYVRRTYREAHRVVPGIGGLTGFEATLVHVAGGSRIGAALADAYAGVFARNSALRRKLVLLLAILETRAPFSDAIDTPVPGSRPVMFLRLGARAALAVLAIVAGTVILTPVRLVRALAGSGKPS